MSETYSPHTWNTGDIITDTSLNHLETGLYNLNTAVNSGAAAQISILTPTDTTLTLAPFPTTYKWDTVASLTLTVTATNNYHFMFTSPSAAATSLTINGIVGTAGDTVVAGKTYEVDIWAGIALFKEIEVTAVT